MLHILVNNAGATAPAMFADLTDMLDIHVMGAFHCTQAALGFLPTDGTGRIINVTSSAGITGTLGQLNYSAAKPASSGSPSRRCGSWPARTFWSTRWRRSRRRG